MSPEIFSPFINEDIDHATKDTLTCYKWELLIDHAPRDILTIFICGYWSCHQWYPDLL
jgi:hypothetical protein